MTWKAPVLLGCVLAGSVSAQRIETDRRPDQPCPFAAPRLASEDPAEVAWAAHRIARQTRAPAATFATELRDAIRAMSAGTSAEHRRALSFLLLAAWRRDVVIPIADLQCQPEHEGRVPWVALQVRAATSDGASIFELFRSLESVDPGWEYVGGALAIRAHLTFAIELRTQMVPTLRVVASHGRAGSPEWPTRGDADPRVKDTNAFLDFPDLPYVAWVRDKFGLVGPDTRDIGDGASETTRDRAQFRWLAQLTGVRDAVAWSAQFEARFTDPDLAGFEAFAQRAERRARESLAEADTLLRRRFNIPERLALPELKVVWIDERREARRKQPLPERK